MTFNNFDDLVSRISYFARLYNLDDFGIMKLATNFIHKSISYLEDGYRGYIDYWQLPEETICFGTGDCEDTSILLLAVLDTFGIEAYMTIGYLYQNRNKTGHAWVAVKINNRWYTIETTNGEIYNEKPGNYVYTQLLSLEDIENIINEKRSYQQYLLSYMIR